MINGSYATFQNNNDNVYSFLRIENNKSVLIVINLSDSMQDITVDLKNNKIKPDGMLAPMWVDEKVRISENGHLISLRSYGIGIWKINSYPQKFVNTGILHYYTNFSGVRRPDTDLKFTGEGIDWNNVWPFSMI